MTITFDVWQFVLFIIGALVIGGICGLFVTCLCVAAGQADDDMERMMAERRKS